MQAPASEQSRSSVHPGGGGGGPGNVLRGKATVKVESIPTVTLVGRLPAPAPAPAMAIGNPPMAKSNINPNLAGALRSATKRTVSWDPVPAPPCSMQHVHFPPHSHHFTVVNETTPSCTTWVLKVAHCRSNVGGMSRIEGGALQAKRGMPHANKLQVKIGSNVACPAQGGTRRPAPGACPAIAHSFLSN